MNKDVIDPGTIRLKQAQRNSFSVSGTFEAKRNFDQNDIVNIEKYKNYDRK